MRGENDCSLTNAEKEKSWQVASTSKANAWLLPFVMKNSFYVSIGLGPEMFANCVIGVDASKNPPPVAFNQSRPR